MENIAFASIGDALYEQDYYAWTEQQAALLQAGQFTEIDLAHLIEEVEDMGRSQRRAVQSALVVVLIPSSRITANGSREHRAGEQLCVSVGVVYGTNLLIVQA